MYGHSVLIVLLLVTDMYPVQIDVNNIIERDKKALFLKLRDKFLLQDKRVESVLLKYDRALFLPFYKTHFVYKDKYIYLGCGAEFSSPFVQAEALHLLRNHLKPGANVLELGSGTGYLATCMAEMVQSNGSVIGLDLVSPLVDFSVKATVEHAPHLIEQSVLKFFVADGRYGYKQLAPYDVIYTDCSLRSIPSVLLEQLKPGGRLIMTLGRTDLPQYLICVDKDMLGRPSYARVRLRNKVPRLCTNIKEQDLYYQRMYPLKHKQHMPTLVGGVYMDPVGPTQYYTLPESYMGKMLNTEEMEHFAAAEKRYQEKVEQIDADYHMDDPAEGRSRSRVTTQFQQPGVEKTTPEEEEEDGGMQYEIWSAV